MGHKVKRGQTIRIITIKVVVAYDGEPVEDEISAHLSENGCDDPDSCILDWGYTGTDEYSAITEDYEEGDFLEFGSLTNANTK